MYKSCVYAFLKLRGLLLLIALQWSLVSAFGQGSANLVGDTLQVNGQIGLLGRWQTGNLSQLSVMPNGALLLDNRSFHAGLSVSYHFLRVNGFTVKDDLWINGLFQSQPDHRWYFSAHAVVGYAASYRIDHSSLSGAGLGWNIRPRRGEDFVQLHVFAGYLNFKYQIELQHAAVGLGSLLRVSLPVGDRLRLRWELTSYHSARTTDFWGGGNLLQLHFLLTPRFSVNITHQTYYNHQTVEPIEQTNTEMLFGVNYSFSKH